MAEQGVTAAAMEVSSHALALGRVAGTSYDVAVFTNLSQDHLDFHETIDDYFAAKATLFTPGYARAGVVNIDDEHGRMLAAAPQIPLTTYSAAGNPAADWRAADVRGGADGSAFRVIGPGGVEADASVALPGPFNVANALAAIVALVEAGSRDRHRGGRASPPARACPGAWSGSRPARTSPCSSTTRTSPARCGPCSTRCGRSPRATSRSCWAAAATGTGPSAR